MNYAPLQKDQITRPVEFLLHVVFPLSAGLVIYLTFRQGAVLHSWFPQIIYINPNGSFLLEVLAYNIPDGLWMYAMLYILGLLWSNHLQRFHFFIWLTIAFLIAILHEFGQLIKIFPGRFDLKDISLYTLIGFYFIINRIN